MHLLIIWTKDLMKKNLDSYDHETKSGLVIKNTANNNNVFEKLFVCFNNFFCLEINKCLY